VYAGKIVPKSILLKPHHREKVNIVCQLADHRGFVLVGKIIIIIIIIIIIMSV